MVAIVTASTWVPTIAAASTAEIKRSTVLMLTSSRRTSRALADSDVDGCKGAGCSTIGDEMQQVKALIAVNLDGDAAGTTTMNATVHAATPVGCSSYVTVCCKIPSI
jgi:hypothetical protein